jgi:hypothetical protein
MPGSLSHLARRFIDVLTSEALTPDERDAVDSWLTPELAAMFFEQHKADQRHGYHTAATVVAAGHDDSDVVISALLHDVGKRHARLGVLGRSLASILILSGLPLTDRMTTYRDHGLIGARDLATLGAPSLAIDFTMHHHSERPATIAPDIWDALQSADQAPNARRAGH